MHIGDPLMSYAEDFYPSRDRILASILFLMHIRPGISQYQIVKSIFIADKAHMNEAGRPVTFDKYVAMPQGPVPSLIYALLMEDSLFRRVYERDPPWSFERRGKGKRYFALEPADMDSLSRTDLDALRQGLKKVQQLTPDQLEELLHNDPAYVEAWSRRRPGSKSIPMKAVKLLANENREIIDNLADISFPA